MRAVSRAGDGEENEIKDMLSRDGGLITLAEKYVQYADCWAVAERGLHKYEIGTGLETEDTGALSGRKEGRIIEGISISIATCHLSITEVHLVEEVTAKVLHRDESFREAGAICFVFGSQTVFREPRKKGKGKKGGREGRRKGERRDGGRARRRDRQEELREGKKDTEEKE